MSNQTGTTEAPPKQAQAQPEPQPCKAGCGFFGNKATGDCCSKCYNEKLAKEAKMNVVASPDAAAAANVPPKETEESTPNTVTETKESTPNIVTEALSSQSKPMDIVDLAPTSSTSEVPQTTTALTTDAAADTATAAVKTTMSSSPVKKPLKKKKKKASYKSMMAGMMTLKDESGDCQKHADKIRSNTGGGTFTKVDRI